MKKGMIYVVGLGPGEEMSMTLKAKRALEESEVIAGYQTYVRLIQSRYPDKIWFENGMTQEVERCRKCVSLAREGKVVSLICSGDAGVYGMASPLLETLYEEGSMEEIEVEVIPGISASCSGSTVLGAPLNHDFCVISLSDLLTPKEQIEKRLRCAAQGDFAIAIYNPSSKKRGDYLQWACRILLEESGRDLCCGYVRNIGREGEEYHFCTLSELANRQVDMFTTVFIGNSKTRMLGQYMVTPRGYGEKAQ